MQVISKEESLNVTGGAINFSATLLNAIIKGFGFIYDIGMDFGSALRRQSTNTLCKPN